MTDNSVLYDEIYKGLTELSISAFPKKCSCCGRLFESAQQFLSETQDINNSSGLMQSEDDDGLQIIEAYRNCPCGSTLMEFFNDRRDSSPAGHSRREKFDQLLDLLQKNGYERQFARQEIIKVLQGEKSNLLAEISQSNSKNSGT